MRCIMVGTKSTQSTRCRSISSSASRASKRLMITTRPAAQQLLPGRDEGAGVIQRAGDQRGAARLHAVLGDLGVALRGREIDDQLGASRAAAGGHRANVARQPIGKRRVRERRSRARSRRARCGAVAVLAGARRRPRGGAARARRWPGARAREAATRSAAASRRASRSRGRPRRTRCRSGARA